MCTVSPKKITAIYIINFIGEKRRDIIKKSLLTKIY